MRASEEELRGLMISGLDGNAADHAALLRLLVPLLRSFYRRRATGGADDIEDLVQETLIAVHTRRTTYDRDRVFTAWLFALQNDRSIPSFASAPADRGFRGRVDGGWLRGFVRRAHGHR